MIKRIDARGLLPAGLISGLLLISAATASAQTFTNGNLEYTITSTTDKTVGVKAASLEITEAVVPETIQYEGVTYTVDELLPEAFANCKVMTTLTLPKSIKKSGLKAFYYTSKFTTLNVEDPIAFINIDFAAENASPVNFTKKFYSGGKLVTEIIVPDTFTEIKDYAFYNNEGLKKVYLPNTITKIGRRSCSGMRNCTDFHLPERLEYLGYGALSYLPLDTLMLPNTVKEIDQYGLSYLMTTRKIGFPENLEAISPYCLYMCKAMTDVVLPKNVKRFEQSAFSLSGLIDFTIPETVTYIGATCFNSNDVMERIVIGENVDTIGHRAFWSSAKEVKYNTIVIRRKTPPVTLTDANGNLETFFPGIYDQAVLYVPKGASAAYKAAEPWSRFKEIKEIDIDAVGKEIEKEGLTYQISSNTEFTACLKSAGKQVKDAKVMSKISYNSFDYDVISIADNAFDGCEAIQEVSLPSSIKSIGSKAFNGCKALSKVNIPDLTAYAMTDFADSTASPMNGSAVLYVDGKITKDLTLPSGLKEIKPFAFFGSQTISGIEFTDSLEKVGAYAFKNCMALKNITSNGALRTMGDYAFANTGVEQLVLKDSIVAYGTGVFAASSQLTSVEFAAPIKKTGTAMFQGSQALKSVTFNDDVAEIGNQAFLGTGIQNLTLPLYLKKIGNESFAECSNLEIIDMGMEVTNIGDKAFFSTSPNKIKTVTVKAKVAPVCAKGSDDKLSTFSDAVYTEASLVIPKGFKEVYEAAEPWKNFTTMLESNFSDIEEREFQEGDYKYTLISSEAKTVAIAAANSSEITAAVIPATVTNTSNGRFYNVVSIAANGFQNCPKLKSITIPASIISMGTDAFTGSTALTTVEISDLKAWSEIAFNGANSNPISLAKKFNVDGKLATAIEIPAGTSKVSANAFYNAENLTKVTLPEGLASIGTYAFRYCSNLEEISLPQSLRDIADYAFHNAGLKKVSLPDSVRLQKDVFDQCMELTEVKLPKAMTSVPFATFFRCEKLTDIEWPDSLKTIEQSAFNATGVKKVVFPESLVEIGMYSFYNINTLEEIEIGKNVTRVGVCAFYTHGTPLINKVTCNAVIPPAAYDSDFGRGIFFNDVVYTNATLYVPLGSKEAYASAEEWKNFKKIEELNAGGTDELYTDSDYKIADGKILFGSEKDIRVFGIDGRTIFIGRASEFVAAAKGIYLIEFDGQRLKIAF